MTRCPECDVDLEELDEYELEVGDTVNCPGCSVELKVLSASPLEVVPME
jgi:hypothetical protein